MQESILKEFVGLENTKIETIGRGAFAYLTRLNTLLLPKTLKTMGASGDAALSPIAKAGLSVIVLNSSISNAVTLQYNIENEEDSWTYNLSAKVGEMQPKGVYSKGQFELSWKVEKLMKNGGLLVIWGHHQILLCQTQLLMMMEKLFKCMASNLSIIKM